MTDPVWAMQAAIYSALTPALDPIPFYDPPPDDASMPYVVFDNISATPSEPLASRRDIVMIYVSVWTKGRDRQPSAQALNTIYDTIHRQKLTLTTGRNVLCEVIRRSTSPDIDEQVFKGQAAIRCIVSH